MINSENNLAFRCFGWILFPLVKPAEASLRGDQKGFVSFCLNSWSLQNRHSTQVPFIHHTSCHKLQENIWKTSLEHPGKPLSVLIPVLNPSSLTGLLQTGVSDSYWSQLIDYHLQLCSIYTCTFKSKVPWSGFTVVPVL